jgi:TRAP transporter TAXI family solute receptor
MKKITVLSLSALVIGLFLAGNVTAGSSADLPRVINLGTHPVGSTVNASGTGIAAVVSKHTPMQVRIKAVAGPSSWLPMMMNKEIEFGLAAAADCHPAYLGKGIYDRLSAGKGFPIRLAVRGPVMTLGTVVSGKCSAKTIPELRGLRLCGSFAGVPSAKVAQEAALANGGLTWDDVKVVPVSGVGAAVKAVIEGKADASWASVGMPVVRELAAKRGARYLSISTAPEALARQDKVYPYSFPNLIKGGRVPGIDVDTMLMGMEVYLVCPADTSDKVVYEINKALWENYKELGTYHPILKTINQKSFVSKKLFTPYHPGAIEFLKENGLWSDKLQTRQEELLAEKK